MKYLIIGNILFWSLFVLSGEAVALIVGILNFFGIVIVALINASQNRRISALSTNIDGKMDALLDANKRADIAEGKETGREQVKTEQAAEKSDEPTEVIVVKPAEVIVVSPADVNIVEDKTKAKK